MRKRAVVVVLAMVACGGQMTTGFDGGSANGGGAGAFSISGGGSAGSAGGPGGGSAGSAGGFSIGGGAAVGGGSAGGSAHICTGLGAACSCPDAGAQCSSRIYSDPDFALCLRGTCARYCNARTQMEREALCPMGFQCVNYAFENDPPTWQCRRP